MKDSNGKSQPGLVAAAFVLLYLGLRTPFLYRAVLIATHVHEETNRIFWQEKRLAEDVHAETMRQLEQE